MRAGNIYKSLEWQITDGAEKDDSGLITTLEPLNIEMNLQVNAV